jgi:hypothetical protein
MIIKMRKLMTRPKPVWEFSNDGDIVHITYVYVKANGLSAKVRATIDLVEDLISIENCNIIDTWIPIELMRNIVMNYEAAKKTGKVL